ncbi:hypothetical protein MMC10_006388 [Thelotrema lepadinum]|nr:hypothetical protein [Thelotrema lepadinum]
MKTRSKPAKASKTSSSQDAAESISKPMPIPDENPPQLFILPKSLSKDARIITLAHPRTLAPTRCYHCPETGLYEIKRTAAPSSAYQSLLLAPEQSNNATEAKDSIDDEETEQKSAFSQGYISKTVSFFTVTPIDPLLLLLPVLSPKPKAQTSKSEEKTLFLCVDDLLENFFEHSKHLQYLSQHGRTKQLLESRLAVVCDSVDAGDEKMYRLNKNKLLAELLCKARRMAEGGLPPSMEEHFVKRALDVPMASLLAEEEAAKLKREESSNTQDSFAVDSNTQDSLAVSNTQDSSGVDSKDSRSVGTIASGGSSQTSASIAAATYNVPGPIDSQSSNTVPPPPVSQSRASASALQPTPELIYLLRLRTSLSFLFASYVPQRLASALEALLDDATTPEYVDFKPLKTHLDALSVLRAEAAVHTRVHAGGSRKRMFEEEEGSQLRAEKKAKKEEEEKKKKLGESRGVKNLKKVDTTGMKKMSDFFKKK